MQVTHTADHVTHAVIGRGETIDFGISSSAEFFNILSSTLYKDQILAVVREALCNGWDAHIEAGRTHLPVEVTVDETKIVFKDHGKGIHHDDIGLIYGTYGNSTKKNDGKQTGGFGLGCKSPFAYTDHFQVVSCHGGVKTIYAMAKSSAEVAGKPGITTIVQVPCDPTETGLTVSINLKPQDAARFRKLVDRIARNGDMNVTLNGMQIDGLDFDTSKGNWHITAREPLGHHEMVMVRYGNVIYPVDREHPEIKAQYLAISQRIEQLVGSRYVHGYRNYGIVFQAPPHSISVTPSRESLSMQEHTVKTLKGLFAEFLSMLDRELPAKTHQEVAHLVTQAVAEKRVGALLKDTASVPRTSEDSPTTIDTIEAFADRYVHLHYPSNKNLQKRDLPLRLRLMADAGLVDRGMAASLSRDDHAIEVASHWAELHGTDWLQKRIVGRLVSRLLKAGLEPKNLLVWERGAELQRADKVRRKSFHDCLPFLRNIVVLTHTRAELWDRVRRLQGGPLGGPTGYAELQGYLVYVIGRRKNDRQEAQDFFRNTRMTVIDMTELEPVEKPLVMATPTKPRAKGLLMLRDLSKLTPKGTFDRIENPAFLVRASRSNLNQINVSMDVTHALVRLFGDVAGIAVGDAQYQSWQKKAPDYATYLIPKVLDYVNASPAIQAHLARSVEAAKQYDDSMSASLPSQFTHYLFQCKPLMKRFGLLDQRTEEEKHYTTLFRHLLNDYSLRDHALKPQYDVLNNTPIDPALKGLLDKAYVSKLLRTLELYRLNEHINNPVTSKKALQLFFYALNN